LYRLMTSPTVMPDGHSEPYGFGLAMGRLRGREVIEHSGGIFGFSTYATYIPSEDRKSTRLNSSHSQISYAVFCLKKKKNHTAIENIITITLPSNELQKCTKIIITTIFSFISGISVTQLHQFKPLIINGTSTSLPR